MVDWVGADGRLTGDWIARTVSWFGADKTEDWRCPPSATVLSTITAFLDAVERHERMPITGEDGYRAVAMAEACYRSAQSGGIPVRLPLKS